MPSLAGQLDRLTIVAPLGLRFHDTVSGALVGAGLNVSAYPTGRPTARQQALNNRSGVYVLHHAAGLRQVENGDGSSTFWKQTPANKSFVIEVSDGAQRFQPFQFTENLPVEGIYRWTGVAAGSPPAPMSSIPLYSSPVRVAPAGMAIIRADLWDPIHDSAAAWALMEVFDAGNLIARGFADELGRIALIFPYPPPRTFAVSSPPGSPVSSPPLSSGPPLSQQLWTLQIKARYQPPPAAPLPDLRFTLSQTAADIWADAARTEHLLEAGLQYGRELILKSRPSPASPPGTVRESVLFVTPAVSPP